MDAAKPVDWPTPLTRALNQITAPSVRTPSTLKGKITTANVVVSFQVLDCVAVDDLSFVDKGGMAPETEMHVLLGYQDRGAHAAELSQQFSDPLHDDGREPFERINDPESIAVALSSRYRE